MPDRLLRATRVSAPDSEPDLPPSPSAVAVAALPKAVGAANQQPLVQLLERLLEPASAAGSLWLVAWVVEGVVSPTWLLVSVLAFVVLGSVLEGIPAIVLFGPLLFPIARQMGVHEVHYAMVVVLAMGIGLFAPPFGVGYYAACAIGRVDPREGMRPILGYVLALLVGLAVVTAFPWISTGFIAAR